MMDVDCSSARERLGRTLGGTYHLKEVLGAGGTAVVYRAQAVDGRMVAIKVLHDHLSRSEEVCRRFVREGQLGNVLDHSGTVRVLDHGSTVEGCPYLVLEFLEGESLEERRVRLGGRLELSETLDFADQLLAVLEIAHARNIVHRDIKPSNLFVTKGGRLKVLDFGIARLTDDTSSATSTKTGQMIGTPAFMPPEQALSRPRDVDARTDLWSVGATMFTLLSGEHVHIAETSSEHLVKAATLHARSLARALPGVPSNVEALVARCLSFDKNERWPSATSMRTELSLVRANPGRRIGTSTSPPPSRGMGDTTTPTVVGSTRGEHLSVAKGRDSVVDRSDRTSDSVMAISAKPNLEDRSRPRRRWLVPVALASTSVGIVAGGLLLVLAVRTTASSHASVPATTATTRRASATDPLASSAVAATPSLPASSVPPPLLPSPHASPTGTTNAVVAAPRPVSMSTVMKPVASAPAVKKAAASNPPSRKDLYRPF